MGRMRNDRRLYQRGIKNDTYKLPKKLKSETIEEIDGGVEDAIESNTSNS